MSSKPCVEHDFTVRTPWADLAATITLPPSSPATAALAAVVAETTAGATDPDPESPQSLNVSPTTTAVIDVREDPSAPQSLPPSPTWTGPVVLIVHGLLSHKDSLFLPKLAAAAAEGGAVAVRFTARGNKGSTGTWTMSGYEDDVADAHAVMAALGTAALGSLNVTAVIGHSRGANDAVLLAASPGTPSSVITAVALAPRRVMSAFIPKYCTPAMLLAIEQDGVAEWKTWHAGLTLPITAADIAALSAMDMDAVYAALPRPVTLIHGDADDVIPYSDSVSAAEDYASRGVSLVSIPGANHSFNVSDGVTDAAVAAAVAAALAL